MQHNLSHAKIFSSLLRHFTESNTHSLSFFSLSPPMSRLSNASFSQFLFLSILGIYSLKPPPNRLFKCSAFDVVKKYAYSGDICKIHVKQCLHHRFTSDVVSH